MVDRTLEFLFNNVFLPPQLPYRDDQHHGEGDRALVEHLVDSCYIFRGLNEHYTQWSTILRTLRTFRTLHKSLSKDALKSAFRDARGGAIIVIHIAMQNSGLIIRKVAGDYVVESFEASPPAAEILAAEKSLLWDFPSRAIAVPSDIFEEASFEAYLTEFLEKASVEPVKRFAAMTLKAGSYAFESRDTPTPAVVGQLLMSILEANGRKQKTVLTRKRVHDEVCWGDGAENPWRRSPTWLVLRVGIHRSLCSLLGGNIGTLHYKFFMSFVLSSLSKKVCAEGSFMPDRIAFARTKLARRVAKLQQQKDMATPQVADIIDSLFSKYTKDFTDTLRALNDRLRRDWSLVRSRATKRILPLPWRADAGSTVLSLIQSRPILQRVLEEALLGRPLVDIHLQERYRKSSQYSMEPRNNLNAFDYFFLAESERMVKFDVKNPFEGRAGTDLDRYIAEFQQYHRLASLAYQANPEQLSLMLITLLEMWQAIDSLVLKLYPLLADYEPEFPLDLLYPLQVAHLFDLQRVLDIENYLDHRRKVANSTYPSVFRDPSLESFAVRYFDQSQEMQQLASTIGAADERAKAQKEEEWTLKSSEYEIVMKQAAEATCLFIEDAFDPLKRQHDDRHCLKHKFEQRGKRMRIHVHEAVLPSDDTHAKSVIFELLLPKGFAAWRDATWQLVQLGRRNTISDREPPVSLRNYQGLSAYLKPTGSPITLASRTKSFLNTHYAQVRFPVTLDQVCLLHGLKYGLFDHSRNLWTSRNLEKPSFADLCAPHLPPKSVYGSLRRFLHPTFDGKPLSANEIIASQTHCPNSLTTTEFITFQDLRLGDKVQWIRLLRELASSNLNFGTLEVGIMVTGLALVVGPPDEQSLLRAGHWVFQDLPFCIALTSRIKQRLEDIAANWREGQTVECLLVPLHRVWSLATSSEARKEAETLMLYIRGITHNWTRVLRREICNAISMETAQKRSQDALLAALLCRKTFCLEADESNESLQADMLAIFLECSFMLKDNLPSKEAGFIGKMPDLLRKLYVSDLKLVHRLESQLRRAIGLFNDAVNEAVNSAWADAEGQSTREYTSWNFLPDPHDGWVTAQSISVDGLLEQKVLFDILEGTLLIDGHPLGRLPDEYTKQNFFHQIFGTRVFMTYPSSIRGMSYQLASRFENHQIHFGFRDGVPFMRARSPNHRTLELIPPTVFLPKAPGETPDLPLPLINDCVHWLDLAFQSIEIRSSATMWRSRPRNWVINLRTSEACRRTSLLVDPRSSIFNRIATIIEPFEHRSQMIVYQPQRKNISLHLPGLELSFQVNSEGLLESQQLRAVVDSEQDAGTLYGIESKLVLRDSVVPADRSIVVAMGSAKIKQNGAHVRISISHTGFYARFSINEILGRLECASEPRLIYFKAYCHAITAFTLPDPLTGRTGTDEAIHCLQSGNAQPWAPVDEASYGTLSAIADLTPRRVYYPEKLKVLQKVSWKDYLSPAIQHDEFRPIIRNLMQQCRVLHQFHLGSAKPPADDPGGDEHLLSRAKTTRNAYRALQKGDAFPMVRDRNYVARDYTKSPGSRNAYESASLIRTWSHRMSINRDLSAVLEGWPLIQGFQSDFELYLLADLINVNLATNWGSLFTLCQKASEVRDKSKLMFLFATMSFGAQIDMTVMRTLIAVAIVEDFQTLQLPRHLSFTHFRRGQVPNADFLSQLMKPYRTPYPNDERALLPVAMQSKQRRKLEMAQFKHEQRSEDSCRALARHLLSQWPVHEPSMSSLHLEEVPLLDAESAYQTIKPEWERLFANYELSEHLGRVQNILKTCQAGDSSPNLSVSEGEQQFYSTPVPTSTRPTLQLLLRKLLRSSQIVAQARYWDCANVAQPRRNGHTIDSSASVLESSMPTMTSSNTTRNDHVKLQRGDLALIDELQSIIRPFADSGNPVRRAYGRDLQTSTRALEKSKSGMSKELMQAVPAIDLAETSASISSSLVAIKSRLESIRTVLTQGELWLEAGALLPDITPVSLLEMLRPLAIPAITSTARDIIINYGELVILLQHTLRIQGAALRKDVIQLANETRVISLPSWQARDHPDWLLLELDFNIRIRPDQHQVALAMTSPNGNCSFCLQMNMGQGKSSIIVPMVVAQLADTKNLVRVVVPRPLLLQTAQLLQARLGGLIGRKIRHVPFSRRSSTAVDDLKAYHNLHVEMLRDGGIILTLPEHMLSFQLSGLQELSSGHTQQAASMIGLQKWLVKTCRDILDECDHMLAVKTQLIYPSGAQTIVDGHPGRWKLVQDLLKLVKAHLGPLRRQFPGSIEVIERYRGAFPTIYLLTPQVKDALMQRLTDSVINGESGILPIDGCSLDELASVNSFLRECQFSKATALKVAGVFKRNADARQRLLLLRGLLIHKILLLGLSKRWNVQYGIDTRRDPIAVPYKAKGIASDQAEFGHPDVSIILTCLSFYYSGLSLPQFRQTLIQLIKSDDEPVREFDSWTRNTASFPSYLRSWSSINVDDETQCTQLWGYLRQQMAVINYFLNHHVFPRHSRVFERKLVSSGWDIATNVSSASDEYLATSKENILPGPYLAKGSAGRPTSLTVGFSGTNDNKTLLPLNILQDDLPGLAHTNADVLTYLLQPRNRRYVQASTSNGKRLNEKEFLNQIHYNGIRMLLDAGAQILEMDNMSLAQAWLEVDHEAEAAVFFGEDDRARVLYRDGKSQPLAGSPFLKNLGACVVYLDEAHTRGVDLKMPTNAVAALTLGIQQTKDHTVQAAMRLRQLAISQSIVFFAPPEVHQSILNFRGKTAKDVIGSPDVITWLLEQTCCSIEQLQPLYISQGLEYCRRRLAAHRNPYASTQQDQRKAYLKVLEQPEQYSLEKLYGPDQKTRSRPVDAKGIAEIAGYVEKLDAMKKGLRNTGDAVQASTHQEVEQEREVQIEVETVREVKRPLHATPIKQQPLQKDVKSFAETGRLIAGSQAYQQAFVALRQTALGRRLEISDDATESRLFVTQDFSNTVVVQWGQPLDEYSRPVHWILWSAATSTALIISDFEADAVLPLIRDRRPASTHLITYEAPITRSMIVFDTLKLYTVPSLPADWRAPTWLVRDLGIFAGRLYFDFDDQSQAVYQALGLPPPASTTGDLSVELTEMDLWHQLPFGIPRQERKQGPFSKNPLLFMQEWLAIRRKGQDFSQSMIGELIRGRRLERSDVAEREAGLGEDVPE